MKTMLLSNREKAGPGAAFARKWKIERQKGVLSIQCETARQLRRMDDPYNAVQCKL